MTCVLFMSCLFILFFGHTLFMEIRGPGHRVGAIVMLAFFANTIRGCVSSEAA